MLEEINKKYDIIYTDPPWQYKGKEMLGIKSILISHSQGKYHAKSGNKAGFLNENMTHARRILFVQGRIQFVGEPSSAAFPCLVVRFDKTQAQIYGTIDIRRVKEAYGW